MSSKEELGARFKQARTELGLHQGELAKMCGLDQAFISRLEKGEAIGTIAHLLAISKATRKDPNWFLLRSPSVNPSPPRSPTSAKEVAKASHTPEGLKKFAKETALHKPLSVTPEEWSALASIQAPGEIDAQGYMTLLLTIRSVTKS